MPNPLYQTLLCDDYLIQHDHVDEEGQPSREEYEEYMDASILSKVIMAKAEEGRKKFQKKKAK